MSAPRSRARRAAILVGLLIGIPPAACASDGFARPGRRPPRPDVWAVPPPGRAVAGPHSPPGIIDPRPAPAAVLPGGAAPSGSSGRPARPVVVLGLTAAAVVAAWRVAVRQPRPRPDP